MYFCTTTRHRRAIAAASSSWTDVEQTTPSPQLPPAGLSTHTPAAPSTTAACGRASKARSAAAAVAGGGRRGAAQKVPNAAVAHGAAAVEVQQLQEAAEGGALMVHDAAVHDGVHVQPLHIVLPDQVLQHLGR